MPTAGQHIVLMNTSGQSCFVEGLRVLPGEQIEIVLEYDFDPSHLRDSNSHGPWGHCGWQTEEIKQVAREIRNRHTRRVLWRRDGAEPTWRDYKELAEGQEHTVVGTLKVLPQVWSPQLGNHRDILVYLPPSYDEGKQAYPVLYMHDGQNLFDEATSFSCEWAVDETMEEVSQTGLEAIVVGIPNMEVQRCDEYSPFVDPRHGGGQGAAYVAFIVETLKPLIDETFRSLSDREHTGIIGSSMGGLISLYAFFERPHTFGFAGVMSPALWFANRAIFKTVEQASFAPGEIYLDVGTNEGKKTLRNTQAMRDLLMRKGYRIGQELWYVEEQEADHCESAWSVRLRHALQFLLRHARPQALPVPPTESDFTELALDVD
jgi:predicted alpha/beta superfamily hydrolase